MFKKVNQMVDHFPAFRKLWVKSAERMGQAGILRVVDQFMGHLMSAQSLFKIQSIALKIIVVTGDQETGWQAGHGWSRCPGAPEIHRGQKHFFYNAGRRDIWGGKVRSDPGGSYRTYR